MRWRPFAAALKAKQHRFPGTKDACASKDFHPPVMVDLPSTCLMRRACTREVPFPSVIGSALFLPGMC